ncbi:MAG: L-arabinose transporter permease protein [Tenericutes bacterium ADurb.Bin239]|nr:MAG: L-arabinose transporter permease protein [Tenericutes bacterium ADurb.Bin239]
MDLLSSIITQTIIFSVPIILSALGGLLSYKINIVNIGLEGFMVFSALVSATVIKLTGSYIYGLIATVIVSGLLGLVYSFFAISQKANFVITGFAINILSLATGGFVIKLLNKMGRIVGNDITVGIEERKMQLIIPGIKDIPILGSLLSGHTPMVFLTVILLIFVSIFLYKTKMGTYTQVIGENEEAARSVGIKVNRVKYLVLIMSAIIVGFAGFNIAIERVRLFTPVVIAGTGFIAIAAFYCGDGKPGLTTLYAVIFGLMQSIAMNIGIINKEIAGILKMVPYITIVIVLTINSLLKPKNKLDRGSHYVN